MLQTKNVDLNTWHCDTSHHYLILTSKEDVTAGQAERNIPNMMQTMA